MQGVWSNSDDCITILSSSMERLSKSSNTVEQVLELVSGLLTTANPTGEGGMASGEEEEEEEADSDFDDYYSNDFDDDPDVEDKKDHKRFRAY